MEIYIIMNYNRKIYILIMEVNLILILLLFKINCIFGMNNWINFKDIKIIIYKKIVKILLKEIKMD